MNRERVNKVVNDVEEAVVSVREAEESWRGEMREIRGEVESVRELVPRVSLLFHDIHDQHFSSSLSFALQSPHIQAKNCSPGSSL